MAILLTGAGGLFTKLGHWAQMMNDINAIRGGVLTWDGRASDVSATLQTKLNNVQADYHAGTVEDKVIDGLDSQFTQFQSSMLGFIQSSIQAMAQATLVDMANTDTPLAQKTLQAALTLLYQQMVNASASVNASTVGLGAQTTLPGVTNTGNPIIVGTVKAGNGKSQEYLIPETITFACTTDAQTGGATANQEQFSVTGQVASISPMNWDFPLGSGANISMTVVDATLNNSGGNLLQNSDMETYTNANVPDNWNVLAGTAGTDFAKDTGIPYTGSADFKIIGGTGTGASIAQPFNTTPSTVLNAGGTSYKLLPDVPYIVNLFIKADVVPASGVVTVDLVDGNNNPINDDAGTANSFAITLSGITTSYAAKNGTFRMPAALPAATPYKLRIRASTVVPAGSNIFIDHVAMALGVPLQGGTTPYYNGGPLFAIFSGSTKPLKGDSWTLAPTNTAGAFQRVVQKLWTITQFNLQLPSSGAPTVADTLIV